MTGNKILFFINLCKILSVLVFPLSISSWTRKKLPVKKSQIKEHVLRDGNWKLKPNPNQIKTPDTYFSSETSSKSLVKFNDSFWIHYYMRVHRSQICCMEKNDIYSWVQQIRLSSLSLEENRHKHPCLFTIPAPSSL